MNSKKGTQHLLENAFCKYDPDMKGYLTKTEFKCAFIFLIGMKPSSKDMELIKNFVGTFSHGQILGEENEFAIGLNQFSQLMETYVDSAEQVKRQDLQSSDQKNITDSWKSMGG